MNIFDMIALENLFSWEAHGDRLMTTIPQPPVPRMENSFLPQEEPNKWAKQGLKHNSSLLVVNADSLCEEP